ncbi:MAG: CDP-alcohol phosphatidyltransferase family protein [Flavobacterium sp.]|uniref:CDP-alcohol phosphatidyltransferase family protein n=1 Tax=Flavobacterium sp. TaxID=239 RepID=UPI003BEB50F7
MNIKAQIPNLFTMLNLFCGCAALVMVADYKFDFAFYFVCLGIFFDFFDGFFARKFNVAGPLGVQLDSLADMVTSGVVPGYVMFKMMSDSNCFGIQSYFPYLGFVITLGACYRLAKFNIDERQSVSFIGLPTPANALLITSLPLVADYFHSEVAMDFSYIKWFLIALTLLSAYIMNAEIPLFSLKFKNFSFTKYKLQILFLLVAVFMLFTLRILAVPLLIIIYVLLSIVNNIVNKKASI